MKILWQIDQANQEKGQVPCVLLNVIVKHFKYLFCFPSWLMILSGLHYFKHG